MARPLPPTISTPFATDYQPERATHDRFFNACVVARAHFKDTKQHEHEAAMNSIIQQHGVNYEEEDGTLTSLIGIIIDG